MDKKIYYIPIEVRAFIKGSISGCFYNLEMPLSKTQYDKLMDLLNFDDRNKLTKKKTCVLKFRIRSRYSKDNYYHIYVKDLTKKSFDERQYKHYTIPGWLMNLYDTKKFIPRIDKNKIISVECNTSVLKIDAKDFPKEIKKHFPWGYKFKKRN